MNKKNKILIGMAIVALLGGGMALKGGLIGSNQAGKDLAVPIKAKAVSVQVIKPLQEQRKVGMSYKATLEPFQEALVSSQVNGKVVQVYFENGKTVSAGTPLIQIDDRDAKTQLKIAIAQLEASKATLKKIEAGLKNTKNNYDRTRELFGQGAVSKVELDNAQSALDMLMADIASAKAGIETAKGNVESRQTALSNMTIRASIGGIMDGKTVKMGQSVSPEGLLGKIKNVSNIDAVFELDQDVLADVKIGQMAQLRLQGTDNKVYEGVVSSVDLSADPSSRVFKAKVRISNPKGELRPGVFAWVDLKSDRLTKVMTLPVELVSGKEGAYSVFVNEKGIARKKMIMLGEVADNRVEIKAGISATDEIIITNLSTLQDGDAVTLTTK